MIKFLANLFKKEKPPEPVREPVPDFTPEETIRMMYGETIRGWGIRKGWGSYYFINLANFRSETGV